MKKLRIASLLILALLALTAADGDFDIRYLLATIGVSLVTLGAIHLWKRDRAGERWQLSVNVALWGPEDGDGDRDKAAGVVSQVKAIAAEIPKIAAMCEEARLEAAQAADVARESQKIILNAIREMKP